MDKNKLAAIKDLRTEALAAFEAELSSEFSSTREQELSVTSVTALTELSSAINAVRAELASRAAEAAAPAAPSTEELAEAAAAAVAAVELAEEVVAEEAVEEAPAATEEVEVELAETTEEDAEAVAAAALSPSGLESDLSGVTPAPAAIVAGADIPSFTAGTALPSMRNVAQAFIARRGTLKGVGREGDGDNVVVASIQGEYPAERSLHGNDSAEVVMDKIRAVASPEAVVASGGLCAPLEPYYGIQVISSAVRPVRDSLPKFMADRGGVRFLPPPRLSDLDNAIGVTTAEDDAGTYGDSEGDTPFKPCLHVTCDEEQTAVVQAIHRCLTFGNFSARTYPEQVEAWLALAVASHARRAETLLLDAIASASTAVTAAATYSATRSLLASVDQAVAAYRSRNRTSPNISLRVMMPDWVKELIRADLARGFRGGDLDPLYVSDAQIEGWFTARKVNVTFYIDGETGGSMIFGSQGGGAMTAFPSTVVWYLFVEGSFVFLDGGVLDLGLVRDSTLNRTNDYQIFAETFEAVAFYGIESIKVTSTVCPNGTYAPAASGSAPC